MSGAELLDAALPHVDSVSIRAWVNTPHNRPIWEKIAQGVLDRKSPEASPVRLATYIVVVAMGA